MNHNQEIYCAWILRDYGRIEAEEITSQENIDREKELALRCIGVNGDRYSRISLLTLPDSQIDLTQYDFLGEIIRLK